jgi:serine/threonine-protein kinase RsbW
VGSVRVAAVAASVPVVRSALRADLARLPAGVPTLVREDAELVAAELLANAIRHARALPGNELLTRWRVDEGGIEIAVTDGGAPTAPVPADPSPTEPGGRGLAIVESLSSRWGFENHGDGTTVWAVVPVRQAALAGR